MNRSDRQSLLDNIPEADLKKIQSKTARVKVEVEDILEAEFLMKFGWEAYWSIYPEKDRSKGISSKEMMRLLAASRKIDASEMFRNAQSIFIGAASALSGKKANSVFTSATRKLLKDTEADL